MALFLDHIIMRVVNMLVGVICMCIYIKKYIQRWSRAQEQNDKNMTDLKCYAWHDTTLRLHPSNHHQCTHQFHAFVVCTHTLIQTRLILLSDWAQEKREEPDIPRVRMAVLPDNIWPHRKRLPHGVLARRRVPHHCVKGWKRAGLFASCEW